MKLLQVRGEFIYMIEIIVFTALIVLFIVLGNVFHSGKGLSLVAGYNTMSEAEKAKINEQELLKAMGNMSFGLAFSLMFWVASSLYDRNELFIVGLILFIVILLGTIIYVNTSEKFKRDLRADMDTDKHVNPNNDGEKGDGAGKHDN